LAELCIRFGKGLNPSYQTTVPELQVLMRGKQMAEQLEEGDIVRPKSGGHIMTIGTIDDDGEGHKIALCYWFADGERKQGTFELTALAKE
jgi:uncharacterized protein YodC (DUF2158 family)